MSYENLSVVEQLYAAFAKGDIPTVLGLLDAGVVWNEAENFELADHNPYVGPQAVLEGVFMRLGATWDGFSVSPAEILEAGDSVVALGHYSGTHRVSGRKVRAQFAHVWHLKDGKAATFQQYTDTKQFADAAL